MKLIEPNCQMIKEDNPYKLIERIGRTCYKSENLITEDSCYKFVQNLIKHGHFAMLEHARVTFKISGRLTYALYCGYYQKLINVPGVLVSVQDKGLFINLSLSHIYNPKWREEQYGCKFFDRLKEIVEYKYIPGSPQPKECSIVITNSDEPIFHFTTIKFICDRGVSHELVRHRCAIAQESTRYCSYNKEKFGAELIFVKPINYETWSINEKEFFVNGLKCAENQYMAAINEYGWTAQIARGFLPHFVKTEVILTMNDLQWEHFLNMRYYETTGKAHPDCKYVAGLAKDLLGK